MKPLKKGVWKILNRLSLGGIVQLILKSELKESGWFKSFHQKKSIDKSGSPLPWWTYSFIYFIENLIPEKSRVFEYGSGFSTLWLAKRVKSLYSVEHDTKWYQEFNKVHIIPSNVHLQILDLNNGYVESIKHIHGHLQFDIIVVDGRRRVDCLKNTPGSLSEAGVVILDNSERTFYQEGIDFMLGQGFKKLDFWGMAPITSHRTCTSLFYRNGNCLGI